ncbi:MFS transporter [Bifidobacterium goeldii]|uniref:Putative proline/betaine transporter n=1 Tax=Bifidobacterium goeldii TaxID=2306975 RepID=A0A430FLK2_9BIFI|nr:MFS transporter [Bifidobacterium goeldii]RSX53660.1 MFS transporter [Bifidobacterium goeldii]
MNTTANKEHSAASPASSTTAAITASTPQLNIPEASNSTIRKLTFSSFMGNFIEWFDYASYTYFATVIATIFFPNQDPTVSLIQAFAVFALSFVARPIGAAFWGSWGDRHGRKSTLTHSILFMSGATFLIGCLPGYATIGIAAPILLLLLRCCQSFSASGEYAGAATFLSESVGHHRRGTIAGFIPASEAAGLLGGSAVYLIESTLMSDAMMNAWGWRVPFLLAAPFGLITLFIREHLSESPAYQQEQQLVHAQQQSEKVTPLRVLFRSYRKPLVLTFGACVLNAVGFYTVLTYLPTYLTTTLHTDDTLASAATTTTLIVYVAFVIFTGYLSDKFGRKRVMLAASVLFVIFTVPAFLLLDTGNAVAIFAGEMGMAMILALNDGVLVSFLPETFPTEVRLSGFAISFNTANAIFGGTAPLVATTLISATGNALVPAYYLVAIAAIAFVAIWHTQLNKDLFFSSVKTPVVTPALSPAIA